MHNNIKLATQNWNDWTQITMLSICKIESGDNILLYWCDGLLKFVFNKNVILITGKWIVEIKISLCGFAISWDAI